jgi:hypothetical protein
MKLRAKKPDASFLKAQCLMLEQKHLRKVSIFLSVQNIFNPKNIIQLKMLGKVFFSSVFQHSYLVSSHPPSFPPLKLFLPRQLRRRQMVEQTNGQTDKWTNRQMDKQTNGQTDKWTK